MWIILFRTILLYFILIGVMRLMGKRQLGELEVSELIVAFMLSELASAPMLHPEEPLWKSLVPIFTLLALELILAFVSIKLPKIKQILYGSPSVIIYKGKLDKQELRKQRLEIGELMSSARQAGITDFSLVSCCILEADGKLSFFKYSDGEVALPIIMDRRVLDRNLKILKLSKVWLRDELKNRGLDEGSVFLATANSMGHIYIIERKK